MLGNVVDIARLYVGQGVGIEELIGAGNEALVTGVTLLGHLDSPQEVEGELGRRIMDSMEDLISMMLDDHALDRELEDLTNLVADKARELARTLGRKVTVQELAREGEVTAEQIAEALRLTGGRIEDIV
jgi:RNA polymerase primary sigma factor